MLRQSERRFGEPGGVSPMALTLSGELGDCRLSLRERTSFRGAKGDKVSAIGRQPPDLCRQKSGG